MGGGNNNRWSKLGNIKALEQKAKAALRAGTRNVFISFAMEDEDNVNLLRAHAKNDNNDLEFNDHSVKEPYNSERAEYIRQQISERIRRASVTVVYLSQASMASPWVKWEVEQSIAAGKRVVGVYAGSQLPARLPQWYSKLNTANVPWAQLAAELDR